jgi:Ankyrin repeats (3 copies)
MTRYITLVNTIEAIQEDDRDCGQDETQGMGVDASIKGFTVPHDSRDGSTQMMQQRFDLTHWASVNDVRSLRFCLETERVSPDYRDEEGLTALMRAADRGAADALQLLLAAGAEVAATDADGQSALHYATLCGHAGIAAMLVRGGADVNLPDSDGLTPLDNANEEVRATMAAADSAQKERRSYTLAHAAAAGAVLAVVFAAVACLLNRVRVGA